MSLDNLRHAQYTGDGTQIDDPQSVKQSIVGSSSDQVAFQALVSGGARIRTTPVRVATFGDSTANTNATFVDQALWTASGASVSPEKYLLQSAYSQAYLVANGGISGQTTSQMLARDSAAVGATRKAIQDVLDLRPDVVLLRGGSINNIGGVNPTAQVATCFAEHCQIINRFLSAGVIVIDSGIYGANAGSSISDISGSRVALMQLESLFDGYAAQFPGKVFRPSWTGTLRDQTGAFLPNIVSADGTGVHLSMYGQWLASQAEATIIASVFGQSSSTRYQGINVLKNAATAASGGNSLMAQTGFSGIGWTPTGFSWGTNYGAGRQNGKVEIIDGKVWATMEFVPDAANRYLNLYMPLDAANWVTAAGDVWGVEFETMLMGMNGVAPGPLASIAQFGFTSGSAVAYNSLFSSYPTQFPASGWRGRAVFQPLTTPGANTAPELFWQVTASDTTPFKMGVSNPRLVKLGTTSNWPPVAA